MSVQQVLKCKLSIIVIIVHFKTAAFPVNQRKRMSNNVTKTSKQRETETAAPVESLEN